ncbi:hypothetical protein INT47_001691 [Mucor saturninus]|uniref:Uncharacterized protein n=1 Tax=Mucor saturninus TaxID=64648 RepID=A0A8H7V6U9_9FUNG|nr:hypothetical protein INT47_001691 [Mucor saturninus]
MVELLQKKPFTLKSLVRSNRKEQVSPIITTSVARYNDPYMPHIPQHSHSTPCLSRPARRSVNLSTPHLVTHRERQSVSLEAQHIHHHHYYYLSPPTSPTTDYPPLSPPPLSPTTPGHSWRNIRRSPNWQPAASITSSEDDDDNEPLGLHLAKPFSLLSDTSEDGDDELIPIARLSISTTVHLSAAEKYKAKVRARLHMEDSVSIL